jgi:hypothetical protein
MLPKANIQRALDQIGVSIHVRFVGKPVEAFADLRDRGHWQRVRIRYLNNDMHAHVARDTA